MKLSFISSNAIENASRLTIRQLQNQMSQSATEMVSGQYADIGVSIGGETSQSVDMTREMARIDTFLKSNSLADTRMSTTQQSIGDMSDSAQKFLNQLIALQDNKDGSSVSLAQDAANNSLNTLTSDSNMMLNGQYIFAGINTDVQPMKDNSAAATTAIQTALTSYMAGLAPPAGPLGPTETNKLTADQMTDFIKTKVAPMFTDDTAPAPNNWASWSSASDQNMTSRISNSEVVETSANANGDGMRYLALSTMVTKALMGKDLSSGALGAVTTQAVTYADQAIDGFNAQASKLGLSQARLTKANDSLNAQNDIINNRIVDLQGVDPSEAATNVNSLQTQLETAYTIISKIQQLSLVNYL
jgi:flagellar hook-associated protein 3 FlgL